MKSLAALRSIPYPVILALILFMAWAAAITYRGRQSETAIIAAVSTGTAYTYSSAVYQADRASVAIGDTLAYTPTITIFRPVAVTIRHLIVDTQTGVNLRGWEETHHAVYRQPRTISPAERIVITAAMGLVPCRRYELTGYRVADGVITDTPIYYVPFDYLPPGGCP